MDTKHLRTLARRNGQASGQFAIRGQTLNVARAVELIERGAQGGRHPAIKNACKLILSRMAQSNWRVAAGPHAGGHGGGGRGPDQNMHVTLRVAGRSYHVQLDQSGHPWRVTGPDIVGPAPWNAPGS